MTRHFSFFGFFLVVIGSYLLLRKFDIVEWSWIKLFWGLLLVWGAVVFVRGFSRNEGGKVFGGTVAFLFGFYYLLRSFVFIEFHYFHFFSIVLIIVGIAFLMSSIAEHSWFQLIPFILFCGTGAVFILTDYGYIDRWELWYLSRMYWPLLLIIIGGIILIRSMLSKKLQT